MMQEDEKLLGQILKALVEKEIKDLDNRIEKLTITALHNECDERLRFRYKKEKKLLTEHLQGLNG